MELTKKRRRKVAEYSPKNMPEVTIRFFYEPGQATTFYDPGYDPVVEIQEIEINGDVVSDCLYEALLLTFGEDWEKQIIEEGQ